MARSRKGPSLPSGRVPGSFRAGLWETDGGEAPPSTALRMRPPCCAGKREEFGCCRELLASLLSAAPSAPQRAFGAPELRAMRLGPTLLLLGLGLSGLQSLSALRGAQVSEPGRLAWPSGGPPVVPAPSDPQQVPAGPGFKVPSGRVQLRLLPRRRPVGSVVLSGSLSLCFTEPGGAWGRGRRRYCLGLHALLRSSHQPAAPTDLHLRLAAPEGRLSLAWFVPLRHLPRHPRWTFLLRLLGPGSAQNRCPDSLAQLTRPRPHAGFAAQTKCPTEGPTPVILEAVNLHPPKAIASSVSCQMRPCQINQVKVNRPGSQGPVRLNWKEDHTINATVAIDCPDTRSFTQFWEIFNVSKVNQSPNWAAPLYLPQLQTNTNSSSLHIPKYSVTWGMYVVRLTVTVTTTDPAMPIIKDLDYIYIEVYRRPLKAIILGFSSMTVNFTDELVLNGETSSDPEADNPREGLHFRWYCTISPQNYGAGDVNVSSSQTCHPGQTDLRWTWATGPLLKIAPEMLKGDAEYFFRMVVEKNDRAAFADRSVRVLPGPTPTAGIECLENCDSILIISDRFSLFLNCTNCGQFRMDRYTWSVVSAAGKDILFNWRGQTVTGRQGTYLSIKAFAFLTFLENQYWISLSLETWGGVVANFRYSFVINHAPLIGQCDINPGNGIAFVTKFVVGCHSFKDRNIPLTYKVIVSDLYNLGEISTVKENTLGAILYLGTRPSTPSFYLPVGIMANQFDVKLYVQVYDTLGSFSQVTLHATVQPPTNQQAPSTVIQQLLNDTKGTGSLLLTLLQNRADVFIQLMGSKGTSDVHCLTHPDYKTLYRGNIDTFLLTTKSDLGDIHSIRLWHNNEGKAPNWYVSRIKVENLFHRRVWLFMCRKWLSLKTSVDQTFPVTNPEKPLNRIDFFLITSTYELRRNHMWFSIFAGIIAKPVNRLQRLSCCLAVLLSTLLCNIMFFNANRKEDIESKELYHIRLMMIAIKSTLTTVPLQLLLSFLFTYSQKKPTEMTVDEGAPQKHYPVVSEGGGFWDEDLVKWYAYETTNTETRQAEKLASSGSPELQEAPGKTTSKINHQLEVEESKAPQSYKKNTNSNNKNADTTYNQDVRSEELPSQEQPKRKTRILLPRWCVYIAWFLVFAICSISSFFIVFYGLTYGSNMSKQWFLTSVFSFFQSIFLVQTAKILLWTSFRTNKTQYCKGLPWTVKYRFTEIKLPELRKSKAEKHRQHLHIRRLRRSKIYKPLTQVEIGIFKRKKRIKRRAFLFLSYLLMHFTFLALLLGLITRLHHADCFHYNQFIRDYFSVDLTTVTKLEHIYRWLSKVPLPLFHNDVHPTYIYDSSSQILGLPLMRQVRATPDAKRCLPDKNPVLNGIKNIMHCHPEYGVDPEDTKNYSSFWKDVGKQAVSTNPNGFTYKPQEKNWPYHSYGLLHTYGSGGYAFYFFRVVNSSASVHSFSLSDLNWNRSAEIYLYLAVLIFFLAYIIDEAYIIVQERASYVRSVYNLLNFVLKCIFTVLIVFFLRKLLLTTDIIQFYLLNPKNFIPFHAIGQVDHVMWLILGFLLFLTMLKTLRYSRVFYDVRLAQRAIQIALPGITHMAFVVSVYFFVYMTFGYLVFGQHEWNYCNLIHATQTVFSYCVSAFQNTKFSSNRVLGVLFLSSFMLIMICIVVNLFQAVILSAYDEMKQPVYEEPSDEAEAMTYLCRKLRMLFRFLTCQPRTKEEPDFVTDMLYGQPEKKNRQYLGLKTRLVNGKKMVYLVV
ncbi:polycystic kidney disease and receptor for egg jelly-related protein [Echinops telfairi]|uniref:Polycystic kidney disease and receptor for egg jelly-related protein n=1 Tax=Echinops telfairi TaxID=9371 RepID=A0ABM0ZPU1_ECHTE|nr:polycystic kidney disease and receptor for egg jelly-related protein [Echinops telfairi]